MGYVQVTYLSLKNLNFENWARWTILMLLSQKVDSKVLKMASYLKYFDKKKSKMVTKNSVPILDHLLRNAI